MTHFEEKDRNFDDITEHFKKKIYGKRKGQIRIAVLWRDIEHYLAELPHDTRLNILDIGGGFGQISAKLAKMGHHVTVNDISKNMLENAEKMALEQNIDTLKFVHCPYQELPNKLTQTYDIILCHAVLEWLAQPKHAIEIFYNLLKPQGMLSLCFYNPVSKIYRNLILGNFYNLDNMANQTFKSDSGSLTPNNPCNIEDVKSWLTNNNFNINKEVGVRVFSDYVVTKRGGNEHIEEVIKKELEYSTQAPFKWMARYFHILATKP